MALQVAKFSNPNPVVAGTRLTYTILVTNTGPVRFHRHAHDGHTAFRHPPGIGHGRQWRFLQHRRSLLLGTRGSGEAVTVTIVVDVDPTLRQGAVFTNTASVSRRKSSRHYPSPHRALRQSPNSPTSLCRTGSPDPAGISGALRYQLRVADAGPSNVHNVIVTDTLDANTTFVQATLGFGCTEGPTRVITCTISKLRRASRRSSSTYMLSTGLADGRVLTESCDYPRALRLTRDLLNNSDTETTTVRLARIWSLLNLAQPW